MEEEYNPLELLVRGKGVVSVHVHGGSNLKPMDDTTNVPLATHYIANRMCMLQIGSHVLASYRLLPILTTY